MTQMSKADLQVMWNRLLALVEEQAQTLIRAAFSPIVRESGDISAGVFDRRGRMLAQAVTGTPGHINTMSEAVRNLMACFASAKMQPGDIYMTNDPWLASGHLNDFLLMMPVFHEGSVIGFTSCTSHLADLGGRGMGPEGTDIFDEGLLIPPCKLVDRGEINAFLLEIVKANSREPVANEGDIYALIACCEAGATRLVNMMRDFGLHDLEELANHIIDTSQRGTLEAIADLPEGQFHNQLRVDGYETELDLHATLTIAKEKITLDFTGTSGPSAKGINVPLNYAAAYSVFALRCLIGPDIPNNAGSLAPFEVTAPKDCILNAQPPAPVAMRHALGQMTPDLVLGCLHQAMPERVPAEGASCLYDLPLRHTPDRERDTDRSFALELVHNGGTGARPRSDGLSATAFPSGVWGSQVEITEAVAPIIIWQRELITDSGGAGQFRGGLGQRLVIAPSGDQPFMVFLSVERIRNAAAGRAGGRSGQLGRIQVSGREGNASGKCELRIDPGERLIVDTPGGGGFGDPVHRDRTTLARDVELELVSQKAAKEHYGKGS
ncbi:MAG: hydantoinase B/oxoprolinase family protein [Pseudomonadota bacterium]